MISYEQARDYLIQYFFTEINEFTPPSFTETVAKNFLRRTFSVEWVYCFWRDNYGLFISDLIDEYNYRLRSGIPLYFDFIDISSTKIKGYLDPSTDTIFSLFRQALLRLSDNEFELLSARILNYVGCELVYATPQSHDQGIDAFGRKSLLSYRTGSSSSNSLDAWILIQAKHYNKVKISSRDIRDFVGAGILAKHRIYSTECEKYSCLELRAFAPLAYVVVTSGEVKRTVCILARKSGITLLTASELYSIYLNYSPEFASITSPTIDSILQFLRQESRLVEVAD